MTQNPPDIRVKEKDETRLAYIHSNKFISLKSFHRKFFKGMTEMAAWKQLEKFVASAPPFLERIKGSHFEERYYVLKPGALKHLDQKNLILVRNASKQVGLRAKDYTHDSRVTELRVAFEENPDLKNVFWVTDHEIRSGISPEVKAKFLEGVLNKVAWRYNRNQELYPGEGKPAPRKRTKPKTKAARTPDAYFEADYNGNRESFSLEYIHESYNRDKIEDMIRGLTGPDVYGRSFKLIVCKEESKAAVLIPKLKARIKNRSKWFVGVYETAVKEPFSKIWFNLAKS